VSAERPLLSLAEALAAYARELQPLPTEILPLEQALHRVLRAPLTARCDLPRHSQSALDGYVLTAADAAAAPCRLRVVDQIAAGDTRAELRPLIGGEAQRILTGARVPPGAGAVVAQERVRREGDTLLLDAPLATGANIRWQGEELKAGAALIDAGHRLHAGSLAAAALAGHGRLTVSRQPRIAVLVTGDELRPPGSDLAPGQIWDSNGPLIRAWLSAHGHAATMTQLPDDEARIETALGDALDAHDLVLTSGGVSVGDRDYILPVAGRLGLRRVFWEVAQKPGKPLYFGVRAGRALLGLPGNPAAVAIGLALHVRTVLDVLEAAAPAGPVWQWAPLAGPAKADTRRDRLVRAQCLSTPDGRLALQALAHQDSHMLSNLVAANALMHLPARPAPYMAGEVVRWMPLP
jgi:molybdopterin molybdotransferase